MFRLLKKQRLAARGLSCGKTRLAASESTVLPGLEESPWVRGAIMLAAAGVLLLLCLTGERQEPFRDLLASLLVLAFTVLQAALGCGRVFQANSRFALYLGLILVQVGAGVFLESQATTGHLDPSLLPLILPYTLAPLFLSVLMGAQAALSACLAAALWWTVLQHAPDATPLLLSLGSGLVAVLSTLRVRRRSRLLRAGFYAGVTVWIIALLSGLIGPAPWGDLPSADWHRISLESMAAVGAGIFTAVFVSGCLPVLEQGFRITTEISLLEMADLNHPLLRRLSMEAPGTYHHSLAVANLAEACAERTGANPTLCRVSAYFHDVGKLVKPEYFVENMPAGGNPHDSLTPTMSALVILSHVKEGVDLALRNKLNPRLIDAISQHHGTTLVEYFYQRARRQERDARAGGSLMNVRPEDIPTVSEESFRYPGPKPQTLEAVILGLADAAESATRSLERPTLQRIDDLVHDLLQDRITDGQYDEAEVTLSQLQEIAATLVSSLGSMLHNRITYRRHDEAADEVLPS